MKPNKFSGEERAIGAVVVAAIWAAVGAGMAAVVWGFGFNETAFVFIVLWLVIFIALSLGWRDPLPPPGSKKAPTAADHDLSAPAPSAPAPESAAAPTASAQAPSSGTAPATPEPQAAADPAPAPKPSPAPAPTPSPSSAPAAEGSKPAALDGPRDGKADDLKQIKGVGPALEKLCNSMGFYHFDQIAAWTDTEVAWVDQNLEGFKGRVSRDDWVAQAKVLAAGGTTEFAARVEKGDVY